MNLRLDHQMYSNWKLHSWNKLWFFEWNENSDFFGVLSLQEEQSTPVLVRQKILTSYLIVFAFQFPRNELQSHLKSAYMKIAEIWQQWQRELWFFIYQMNIKITQYFYCQMEYICLVNLKGKLQSSFWQFKLRTFVSVSPFFVVNSEIPFFFF